MQGRSEERLHHQQLDPILLSEFPGSPNGFFWSPLWSYVGDRRQVDLGWPARGNPERLQVKKTEKFFSFAEIWRKRAVSDVSPPSIVLIDLLRWSHYIGGRDESIISNEGA